MRHTRLSFSLRLLVGGALSVGVLAASAQTLRSGIDLAGMDRSLRPGDDFEAYANGQWRKQAVIPPDRASTGVFLQVFEKAEQRTAALVQGLAAAPQAPGGEARKIADYYRAFMDEEAIERAGLAPLGPALATIDAIRDRTGLARALGGQLRADVDPINATHFHTAHLFGLFVTQGLEDPAHNMPYLLQGGLGMPSREYYLSTGPAMAAARGAYRTYVAKLLRLAGDADAERKAGAVLDLETRIARAQASLVDSEDVHKANNPWPRAAYASRAPGLDWTTFFAAAGLDHVPVVDAWQPQAIRDLSALVASQPLTAGRHGCAFMPSTRSRPCCPGPMPRRASTSTAAPYRARPPSASAGSAPLPR